MGVASSKPSAPRSTPAKARKTLGRERPVTKPASRRDVLVDMGNGSLPLYKSIKLEVTRALSGGEVKTGMALPTEKELSERFGVSVGTVRRALSELVADKVLIRQQGRGTFLAPFDSKRMLNSFWHVVRKDGVREVPIVQTLRFEEATASAHAAKRLGIHAGEPIYWIVNLMLMGGSPMLLDGLHIPQSLFPGLTKAQFVGRNATIYDLYRDSFGISIVNTVDQLTAVSADLETAKKLGLALGTPLLEIVRVAHTFHERPVELRRSLLYTEKYEFIDVTGGSSTS